MKRKCLLTGATGLIGGAVLPLLKDAWEVYTVGREKESAAADSYHIPCDLSGQLNTGDFPKEADVVIHLAQSTHFRNFPDHAGDIFAVNTASTVQLLDYARRSRVKTFLLASSGGVYGYGGEAFREEDAMAIRGDLGFYLSTRICAELLAEHYAPYMNIIVLRFFFIYGPSQSPDRLIPKLIESVRQQRPIVLQGVDGIRINPAYVTDAAGALVRAIELTGRRTINVGGPDVLTLRQIGETIGRALGKEPVFEVQREAAPRHLIGDIAAMSRLLRAPQVHFDRGINRMIRGGDHD